MRTKRVMLRVFMLLGWLATQACGEGAVGPADQDLPDQVSPDAARPTPAANTRDPATALAPAPGGTGPEAAAPTVSAGPQAAAPAATPVDGDAPSPAQPSATNEPVPSTEPADSDGTEQPGDNGASADDCLCRGDDPTEAVLLARTGPFSVESFTDGFPRPSGVTSATVFYPTDAEPPFAGVAVVPGFVSPEASIRDWGPFLASHGIVTVTIGVPGGDQPRARKTKLLATIDALKAEHARAGSALHGKLDVGRLGLAGWSMGGGGTAMAIAENPQFKAAVTFAAWGPAGGGQNQVPVLMFEATSDALAARMSDGYYGAVPDTTPKMLFEVQGSSHSVANSPHNHNGIIGKYGLSWFKVFLEDDDRYRQFLTGPFPSITTAKSAHNL